jgi:hypothetical protein
MNIGNRTFTYLIILSVFIGLLMGASKPTKADYYSFDFDAGVSVNPDSIYFNSNVQIVVYTGDGDDGYIRTLSVSANGSVVALIDYWEFDNSEALECKVVNIGNIIYIFYRKSDLTSKIISFSVGSSGTIQKSILNSYDVTSGSSIKNLRIDDLIVDSYGNVGLLYFQRGGADGLNTIFVLCSGSLVHLYSEHVYLSPVFATTNYSDSCISYFDTNYQVFSFATVYNGISKNNICIMTIKLYKDSYSNPVLSYKNYTYMYGGACSPGDIFIDSYYSLFDSDIMVIGFKSLAGQFSLSSFEIFNSGLIDDDNYIARYNETCTNLYDIQKINSHELGILIWGGSVILLSTMNVTSLGIFSNYHTEFSNVIGVVSSGCLSVGSLNSVVVYSSTKAFSVTGFADYEEEIIIISSCGDFTGYESIGETFGSLPTSFTTDTLEQEYDIVSSFTLFGVELPIHISQYTFDSDYTNYNVRINGAVFHACSIIDYLAWEKIVVFDLTDTPIAIIDEKVLFEFYNDNGKLNGMITSLDRDFDGNRNLKHGDNTENGVYDGSLWGVNVEFLYRFYYTSMVIPTENPGLGNSISFGGYAKKNSSIPLYYLNDSLYSGVIVYSTVDSLIPDRYVRLYYANNHTEITISDFPLLMDNYFMASGVIAFSVGNFYVNISNYDETITYAHSHFDVINNPDESDMWIQSEPPITLCLEDYTITYKYLQENGHMGCIAMFLDDDIYNIGDSYYHGFLISSNTTDSFSYRPLMGGCGNQYWTFFVYINGTYFPTGIMHIHMQYTGDTENNIDTLPKNNAFIGDEVTIYGNHNFIGQDIRILFNGVTKYYVGMEQSFSYPTIFTKKGAVNITLCRYLSNSSYDYLDSVIIMISENEEIEEPIVLLEPPFSYIAGAIITILFLVMPVILIGSTVKDIMQSDLLKYIPVFSGSLGFIVSCLIGFFPWYAIFILVSIIVMILAVLYLSKKNQ